MILISHRGNINGPNKDRENSPDYILEALQNYHVEIDVWLINGQFMLGHDVPTYITNGLFLSNPKLWCHAKNLEALVAMQHFSSIHCFWHQNDDVTLTSRNYIWTYPGKQIASERAIAVVPEQVEFNWDISMAYGVCSDYVQRYKD